MKIKFKKGRALRVNSVAFANALCHLNATLLNKAKMGQFGRGVSLLLSIFVIFVFFSGCAISREVSIVAANNDNVIATIDGQKVQLLVQNITIKEQEIIYIYNADNPKYMDSAINSTALNGPNNIDSTPAVLLSMLSFLGFLFPGMISMGVDGITGAGWQYKNPNLIVPVYLKQ